MRLAARVSIVLTLVWCVACGDEGSPSETGDEDTAGTPDVAAPDTGGTEDTNTGDLETYSLSFPPVPTQPFEEDTQCVIMRLNNPERIRVGTIDNVLGETSHHYIVYATSETQERPEPFDCFPFVGTLDPEQGAPLMITQRAEETLELPEGVAFTFEPNQMVRLELHYINLLEEPVDVTASTTFTAMPEEEFENEADFLFVGSIDVSIRAGETETLGPVHFPVPGNLAEANFWGITGHTHQWGTDVTITVADDDGGPETDVYEIADWDWDEPETVYFDPPFQVPEGGGFNFSCTWENLSDRTVGFGESANDEMCFFWAYYYPSQGAFVCFHSDQFGGIDTCCPGGPFCNLIENF